MRELHLFAGAGGGILGGMLLGHTCVGAVEIDLYCQRVLKERQADGLLPEFPIHDDIRTFDAKPWRGRVDIVCGGFPCQPWSVAGKRLGTADPRHLWPEMARVVAECRPRFVFAENVSLAAFREPWRDLRGLGYRVPPAIRIGAVDVGAPHRRWRWWLLAADTDGARLHEQQPEQHVAGSGWAAAGTRHDGQEEPVADADRKQHKGGPSTQWRTSPAELLAHADQPRLEGRDSGVVQERASECVAGSSSALGNANGVRQLQPRRGESEQWRRIGDPSWWRIEPDVGRVADGVASRVDRLRALGNGQVPAAAATAFRELFRRL